MRRYILRYANDVVDHEWKTMAHGAASPIAARDYEQIWREYTSYEPAGERERAFFQESVVRLNELGVSRRLRLISSGSTVATPMWILLIAGFVLSTTFTYLFDFSSLTIHVLSVAAITALTAFVLFLIYSLQHPFAGSIAISPEPFTDLVRQWSGHGLAST